MYKSLISLFAIFLSLSVIPIILEPSSVRINLNDAIYDKPMKSDTISIPALFVISVVSPLVSMYSVYSFIEEKKSNRILNYLGFITVQTICASVIENIKALLRSPRPDFIARCKPDSNGFCTGPKRDVINSIKSFPSGHTGLTFSMVIFMICFIRNLGFKRSIQGIISFLLLFLGILMGYSRILDNRHFLKDVLGGIFIGTLCSLLVYRFISKKYTI